MQRLTASIDAHEVALRNAIEIHWPPPEEVSRAFDWSVELTWQSNEARAISLLEGMITALNDSNFLVFSLVLRGFYEQVLLLREYWYKRFLPTIKASVASKQVGAEALQSLISELQSSVRRSKVDWENLLNGNFQDLELEDGMDQLGLKKAAEHWRQNATRLGKYDPVTLYNILCDVAHPNLGSVLTNMGSQNERITFVSGASDSIGFRIFAHLYPSLAAVAMEFQNLQNGLLSLKFNAE